MGNSLQGMCMLGPKPMSFYDSKVKHGLGYTNPYILKKAISRNPKLYDASCLDDSNIQMKVRDAEDILDDATKSQIKMKRKSQDPIAIEKKQNVWTIDYKKLNALYEDFDPQQEFSVEHKYFSSSFISSENSSNASSPYLSSETKPAVTPMPRLRAISNVRRPSHKDSLFKNSILSNTKNSSEKVEVSDMTNKTSDVASKNDDSNKKIVVQIVLGIVNNGCSKHMTGLGQNLFIVEQFCDGDLEGDDLLTGDRESNLYTISISNIAASSPVCLMSKATSTKSWLWHRRLSHLKFGTINDLTKHDLVDGLPKFKYEKDHLCSACELGKTKEVSHPPKVIPSNHSTLELLHMDLSMRVASINGKRYILVIVDDYSRFTRVYFLCTKDETPEIINNFIARVQLNYNAKVCKIRIDNSTEFKNEILKAYYDKLGIMQKNLIGRMPQQNGVVEQRNRTLIEAARTMLIFSRLP
ncbi:retrovirus-related pol polyprotein from transposon TNT 1-94 [Tanacetum coccineum]